MKKIILLIVSVWMCVSCGNLEEMNIDRIIFGSVYFFFFSFQGLTVGDVSETESQFIEVVGAEETETSFITEIAPSGGN